MTVLSPILPHSTFGSFAARSSLKERVNKESVNFQHVPVFGDFTHEMVSVVVQNSQSLPTYGVK